MHLAVVFMAMLMKVDEEGELFGCRRRRREKVVDEKERENEGWRLLLKAQIELGHAWARGGQLTGQTGEAGTMGGCSTCIRQFVRDLSPFVPLFPPQRDKLTPASTILSFPVLHLLEPLAKFGVHPWLS